MSHPDMDEAQHWVTSESARLRHMSFDELRPMIETPIHHHVPTRTGRDLMGETWVYDFPGEPDWLRVTVDICEPRPGVVHAITERTFFISADGSIADTSPLK